MESQRFSADGVPPLLPNESPLEPGKESSKDKDKKGRTELLAQAAIKDVKKPDDPAASPPTEKEKPALDTWLGSNDEKSGGTETDDTKIDKTDTPEQAEASEHITSHEARQLVTEYVDHRLPIVEQERAEVDQPFAEIAALTANKSFLEQLRDEAREDADDEIPPEVFIDQAMNDVLEELGLEDSVATREAEPVDDAAAATMDLYAGKDESGWVHPADSYAEARMKAEDVTTEPETEAGSSGGDGHEPPADGRPGSFEGDDEPSDLSSGYNPTAIFGGGSSEAEPARPAIVPDAPSTSRVERQRSDSERQQAMLNGMLVGGVIGYIIGRRRGRINTEKKFKPIQEKLQKEADTLRQSIAAREQHIRTLAREKAAREQITSHAAARPEHETAVTSVPAEKTPEEIRDNTIATILEVPVATVERAGAESRPPIALNEARPRPRTESITPAPKQTEQLITPKAVEQLPLPAVLKAAESVMIGGKSLKSFYESGRIEEPALRRVLTEHLRGGRTEQALNVALTSHEQRRAAAASSFERNDRTSPDKGIAAQRQAAIEHHAGQFSKTPEAVLAADAHKDPIDEYEDSEAALDVRNMQRNISIVALTAIAVAVILFIVLH